MVFCRFVQNLSRFSSNFSLVRNYCVTSKMPSALLLLAKGAEEMETVISADVLRRGKVDVTIAGLAGKEPVVCSRNVVIMPDASLADCKDKEYDVIILPGGGEGAENLAKSADVGALLKKQEARGAYIAAICAAPSALAAHGIGKGKKVTCYPAPAFKDAMTKEHSYCEDKVVVDGKFITSRGPGTCFQFALAIVAELQGKNKSDELVAPMLLEL